jgi:ABC-type nitrate/sulfonate/bicarbonate transport system permease component
MKKIILTFITGISLLTPAMAQIPTIIMGMLTLGLLGYGSSALVRLLGRKLMVWRGL